MAPSWRDAILETLRASRPKRVAMDEIVAAVRRMPVGHLSDFEFNDRLAEALFVLEREGYLRRPKARHLRNSRTDLPQYVTAIRSDEDEKQTARRQTLDSLRNETAWEPTHMVVFAHTLRTCEELERALQVNRYLIHRPPEPVLLPHRERALEIFGKEKALDNYVRRGLFGGRITLAILDCFYCPEPLPFRPLALDPSDTADKPLLVVENSNTYWSCCRANATLHRYAAIVYGQGFKACAAERAAETASERANDGLAEIEHQTAAKGIRYFGDLDPTGIAIPCQINRYREERGLPPLEAERALYRALLEKNLSVPYSRFQANDPTLARDWLGPELASPYLSNVERVRWPQEGLNVMDILDALR
ncbi:hypothetical protein [Desulfosarcina ovata]|uniref:Wadjet protein JetD C-terminal domain-containing protein n=1 Tax=Desulfosarcina ovata subsp. ovata TaxID=2752305 RepID=A0A5K8ACP8_9BACT|nr:hypothetical protein [Desulfosarcina ovata]BBO90493.1 hypothetical protein DSCOOX_36730 [Desulfosarcina ovata subsp. ovata]